MDSSTLRWGTSASESEMEILSKVPIGLKYEPFCFNCMAKAAAHSMATASKGWSHRDRWQSDEVFLRHNLESVRVLPNSKNLS